MFKISQSSWNKLDSEIVRISDNVVPHLRFFGELFPTSEEVNLKESLSDLANQNKDQCNYEFEIHDDHGEIMCEADVTEPVSDLIKRVVAYLSSSDKLFLGSFQVEITIDDELAGLIYGDAYKGSAILPMPSGKRLEVIELEF